MSRYRNSYAGDPHWITARYPSSCAGKDCGAAIVKGDRAFYYPRGKSLYAVPCGHADANARDFESAAADEFMLGG